MPIINPVSTGTVVSVNNTLPDQDGNVDLSTLTTYEVTVLVADWSSNLVNLTISGLLATHTVWVNPKLSSHNDYVDSKIMAINLVTDTLTLQCVTEPTNDIDLYVTVAFY